MEDTVKPVWLLSWAAAMVLCAQAAGADWLTGKPDTALRPGYQAYYDWIFAEALKQTGYELRIVDSIGKADADEAIHLAYNRLISAANKLADHMNSAGVETQTVEIRYLIIGVPEPKHFKLMVTRARLIDLGIIKSQP